MGSRQNKVKSCHNAIMEKTELQEQKKKKSAKTGGCFQCIFLRFVKKDEWNVSFFTRPNEDLKKGYFTKYTLFTK